MAARKEIREFDLLEFSRCLLRQPNLIPYSKPLEVQAAEQTVRLVLWEMFENKIVLDAAAVRELLITAWKEVREDARGPRGMATIVNRIRELITTVRVVSPVTHYVQKMGATAITGDYAVLAPANQKHLRDVFILRLRMRSEFQKEILERPDVVNWSRWLHLNFHEPALHSIRILNFGIDFDAAWPEEIPLNENQVRAALTGLADAAQSGRFYPTPGTHCLSCQTAACMTQAGRE
jgi:hypothetical protein